MRRSNLLHTFLLAGMAWMTAGAFTPALAQDADDMKRGVARISLINGEVSVQRGDSGDWVAAAVNAPVMAQDRITTGATSRTEIQFDSANMLRVGSNAEVNVAQLEFRRYVMQLARGTVTFRVLRDSEADVELDTPTVSVRPTRRGVYRVTVREDGTSEISVRAGDVDIFTPRGSQKLMAGQRMEARGTASDPEFQVAGALPADDWDRWNESRDRMLESGNGYKYVSRDVYGVEDLDQNGTWVYDAPYGYVWRPTVVAGWAPYRNGRWAWVDWYGWTWVSYDSWGWAPYHYGRWYHGSAGWCWYPGGIGVRHYWSPALVAFFGFGRGGGVGIGVGFGGGWGNVGWVPLAPHERFSPWWGRSYYGGYRNSAYIDRSVNITNVNITNVYRNSRVMNGVTAVNSGDFSRGRFNNYVRVDNDNLRQASLSRGVMPAVPGDAHLRYSERTVQNVPTRHENTRFFSNRQPEQVQRVSFNEQRQSLERVSRVPVSERTAANVPSRNAAVSTGDAGNRGWRRANEGTSGASTPQAAPARNEGGSWRRMGDQGGNATSNANPGSGSRVERQSQAPATNSQAAPSRSEGGSWRRFGDQGGGAPSNANPGSSSRVERQSQTPATNSQAAPNRNDSGNWRRFGDPGSGSQSSPQAAPRTERPSSQSPQRNWSRFGDPGASSTQAPSSPQRTERRSESRDQSYQSAPRQESRQESIRIAPPVVRERSSSGGNSTPRAERQSAPRSENRYSGGSSGGSSGGFSGRSSGGSSSRGNSGGGGGGGRGGRGR